jgi:hypothetical protein
LDTAFISNENMSPKSNQRSLFFYKLLTDEILNQKLQLFSMADFIAGSQIDEGVYRLPFAGDIEFSKILINKIQRQEKAIMELIQSVSTFNMIIVDNCYVSPIVLEAKKINSSLKLVYISHNQEYKLKTKIARMEKWPTSKAYEYLSSVKEIENQILTESDLIFACSEEDLNGHKKMSSGTCIVVPNGGHKRISNGKKADLLQFLGCKKFILYVASGHPPNVHGFLEGIGTDFGFMKPDTKLVIVGSSVKYILERIINSPFEETFLKYGGAIDYANDDLLADLYAHSNGVILPIYEGGGTNIKTAEAFLNAKNIITTKYALRGFNTEYWKDRSYSIVKTREDFKHEILNLFRESNFNTNSTLGIQDECYSWNWITNHYQTRIHEEMFLKGIEV